ncbi:TPA: hypothetical protein H1940_004789 [Salmonella enterica]|nr:hypothetical protein [Salmonella enterica]
MRNQTEAIMNTVKANGKAILKMNITCGCRLLTITRINGGCAVGEHPGGKIRRLTESDTYGLVDDYECLIEEWS